MEWHWTKIGKVKALWDNSLLELRAELRRKSHHYTHTHITGESVTTVLATKPLSLAFKALPSQTLILSPFSSLPYVPSYMGNLNYFLFSIFHLVSLSQCLYSCCPSGLKRSCSKFLWSESLSFPATSFKNPFRLSPEGNPISCLFPSDTFSVALP